MSKGLRFVRYATIAVLAMAVGSPAWSQQGRYTIDPRASLAWWEVNPNLSHLWATTCPEDPSWQPGEGRSIGYAVDYLRRNAASPTKMSDTTKIPLYPRRVVRSLCSPAMSGEITVGDSATLRGVRGEFLIRSEFLKTGLDVRDSYARHAIYETERYPTVRFQIDSAMNVRRGARDSIYADVVGALELRGVRTPMVIPVRVTPVGGGIRVQGKVRVPANDLVAKYGVSAYALGMSVGLHVWKDLFMGVDVVLRPAAGS